MSEGLEPSQTAAEAASVPVTAGGLLRRARQSQGLHIAALAAAIKVTPRKLELLESDQFDQLTDATFTRALAQSVCRTLKIDAAPILALLPPLRGQRLEQVAQGLNTPFNERPGRSMPSDWADIANPVLWVTGLVVIVTLVVYLMPADWVSLAGVRSASSADSSAPTASLPAVAAVSTVAEGSAAPATTSLPEPAANAFPPAGAASDALTASAPDSQAPAPAAATIAGAENVAVVSGLLQLRTSAPSWIEVTDARGQTLIGRVLQPGESVGLDGVVPLKVKIGNAGGTEVLFKGQPFGLAAYTRDNVARLELK